jgi:hypothetical protein
LIYATSTIEFWQMSAKHGESKRAAAWVKLEKDRRIAFPTELLDSLSWYRTAEKIDVLLELRLPHGLIVHRGDRQAEVEAQRKDLLDENDSTDGSRRVALSYLRFQPSSIGNTNRRLTLPVSLAEHLVVVPGSSILLLFYDDLIELLREADGLALLDQH